ncbi:unnamed protein product [Caenorhabditis auriculariae]|uniref:Cadherin domain-containing protein n=1 Tax=Caenorhabditis auriculariae TaxID=2777116 RepID=A0A8S1H8K4_9PELO|nr:unnamed protein product [Caenorhabditis auriculariae]
MKVFSEPFSLVVNQQATDTGLVQHPRCSDLLSRSGKMKNRKSGDKTLLTAEQLPRIEFEPSVVKFHGQKVLATVRGSIRGSVGFWNSQNEEFSIIHSRRTVGINESFWTTLEFAQPAPSEKCNVRTVSIPFIFLPDGSDVPIHTSSDILVQYSDDLDVVCDASGAPTVTARSTSVMCNCGDGARVKCRRRYRSATACGSAWSRIADDTVSLEVLTGFLLMVFECHDVSVHFDELKEVLLCVASIESDCPIGRRRSKRQEYQNDYPVGLVNHLSALDSRLGVTLNKVMPVLNALDVQTIRISSLFIDFIDRLQKVFPPEILEDTDRDSIDLFLTSIADDSDGGNFVSSEEEIKLDGKVERLVNVWNATVKAWKSGRINGLTDDEGGVPYADVKQLVVASDRLKTIARQNVAPNPFAMLHDYMATMLQTKENQQSECARATVQIDDENVEEGTQMRIRAFFENKHNTTLTNIGVTMNFVREDPNTPNVDFNVGPSWSAGIASLSGLGTLPASESFEIHWTRFVSTPRRLTRIAKFQPIIILAFAVDGRQNQQKLFAPQITVHPKRSVRVLNIIKDDLSPKIEDVEDFSVLTAVLNPGYSPIDNLRVNFDGLKIENFEESFEVESTSIDGKRLDSPTLSPQLNQLPSGGTKMIKTRIKSGQAMSRVSRVNLTCSSDGRLLPLEAVDTYAIRAVAPSHNGMLLASPSQSRPLFFFRPSGGTMTNIIQLDYLSTQNSTSNTVFAAFRNPESTGFSGALWASMPMPKIPKNQKLVEIMDRRGQRPRTLQPVTWVSEDEMGTQRLNWIDYGASLPAQVLTYELIFGDPETFDSGPLFDQSQYRVQIPPDFSLSIGTLVGQISAEGENLEYSLFSPDNERRFTVDPENGQIFFDFDDLPLESDEYCLILEARDSQGKTSRVPVAVNNGGFCGGALFSGGGARF